MTTTDPPPAGWTLIGLSWDGGGPALVATRGGDERSLDLAPGTDLRIRLSGPRGCVGVWDPASDRRVACPASVAPEGTDAQCARCAARDLGRALARDAHTDDRDYVLYLAYFGPGLFKVGLTAAARGVLRLLEQGALTYTLLARGPLSVIRAAERAVAAGGFAKERLRLPTKTAAWWRLDPAEERRSAVRELRRSIEDAGLLANAEVLDRQVHDNVARFALDRPVPDSYDVLTGLDDPADLAVRIRAVPGRVLLADDAERGSGLLIDVRLLAGWLVAPAEGPTGGLGVRPRSRPRGDGQIGLF
ncbi:uncharacterized protein DUF2797 [Murinocardiopsis flavida]|uniref:Uncharacterized protein DUF2797 n=1 Tax=Murinocardiopsis flavida TaxID=645275 RepID=A0A2P8DUW7_9ACTN|nr:DUF2797 domain-containing protein [Murinocardiopsis flavida]PSL01023.1 uncharacterized protein DUF2797 [Murinocardiopsis flavida]